MRTETVAASPLTSGTHFRADIPLTQVLGYASTAVRVLAVTLLVIYNGLLNTSGTTMGMWVYSIMLPDPRLIAMAMESADSVEELAVTERALTVAEGWALEREHTE